MNHDKLLKFAEDTFEEMVVIMKNKNKDYTAGSKSAFANFEASADFGIDPVVGLSVRMGDKFKRVQSFCRAGQMAVPGEAVEDAFKDLIGYSVIALAMLSEREYP